MFHGIGPWTTVSIALLRRAFESHQLRRRNSQSFREAADIDQRDIALSPLDGTDVAPRDVALKGQCLLRPPFRFPKSRKPPTE